MDTFLYYFGFHGNQTIVRMNKSNIPGIIIGKLMNIGGMLEREGNRLLAPYNLNYQQFSIFFEIGKAGKVRQKEMVNRLMLEKAHVSKVVKKLQQMELLSMTKSIDDQRSFWLSLTPKGEKVLKECQHKFAEFNHQWLADIEEKHHNQIIQNLQMLQSTFRNKL